MALSEQPQVDEGYDSGGRRLLTSQAAAGYVGLAYSRFRDLASQERREGQVWTARRHKSARWAATLRRSAREAHERREGQGQ